MFEKIVDLVSVLVVNIAAWRRSKREDKSQAEIERLKAVIAYREAQQKFRDRKAAEFAAASKNKEHRSTK